MLKFNKNGYFLYCVPVPQLFEKFKMAAILTVFDALSYTILLRANGEREWKRQYISWDHP
jgi:hypothetical protein